MSEDKEAQEDEILALTHIYDEDVFRVGDEGSQQGGQFTVVLDLPQPFSVAIQDQGADKVEQIEIEYLPPLNLHFQLPKDYPSTFEPEFALSCKWLSFQQLTALCKQLDVIWEENKGEVILFHWMNFLKEESFEFLNISSPLDLTNTIVRKRSVSRCVSSESASAASIECDTPSAGAGVDNLQGATAAEGTPDPRAVQDIASQRHLLPAILDFDSKQKETKFKQTLYECQVCFTEKLGSLCIQFVPCKHVFCNECMSGYFEVQIKDGNVQSLNCPYSKCESQAHPAQVKELVNIDLFHRYDRLLLQCSLDTMMDVMYCPRKSCGCAVMVDQEASMGTCPACSYVFCIFCKLTFHGISPCKIKGEQMRALREVYVKADEEEKKNLDRRYGKHVLKQLIEESFSEEWLNEHSKKCPHCGTHIQKVDGCNKMTCTKCRYFFCWICNATLSRNNPYSHFNTLGSPCFNLLFQGVVIDDDFEDEDYEFWNIQ